MSYFVTVKIMPYISTDTNTSVSSFSLNSILPEDKSKFFRYSGSLTTPGCFETVIWSVFHDTIKISSNQVYIPFTNPSASLAIVEFYFIKIPSHICMHLLRYSEIIQAINQGVYFCKRIFK